MQPRNLGRIAGNGASVAVLMLASRLCHERSGGKPHVLPFRSRADHRGHATSHAAEFGYDGEVLVDYVIGDDGLATFTVELPEECDEQCQDAYAWALSAFASGRWAVGDVP